MTPDYKSLFAFALSVAINRGAEDPEDMAQEAIVRLWLYGECRSPRGWITVTVERMIAKEVAGRERESAREARVRYRPREEEVREWSGASGLTERDEWREKVEERVLVEQIRKRWKYPRRRLGEVRAWVGV